MIRGKDAAGSACRASCYPRGDLGDTLPTPGALVAGGAIAGVVLHCLGVGRGRGAFRELSQRLIYLFIF